MLLCLWAFGLAVGLAIGFAAAGAGLVAGAATLALAVAALAWRRGWRAVAAAGVVLALATVLGWRASRARPVGVDSRSPVEGVWVRTLRWPAPDAPARGLVDVTGQDGAGARVALSLAAGPTPGPGDRVRLRVRLSPPLGLANPGMPDAARAARAQGIDLVGRVARSEDLVIVAAGPWWGPRRLAERAHAALARAIEHGVPAARAPLFKALVLGERTAAGGEVEAGFKAAGAVHALSVSGLHLTAIAAVLFLGVRRALLLSTRLALRVRVDVVAAVIAIPAVLGYCALTGEATATRRAALMAALALGAIVVGRLPSMAAAIGASAIALLLESPLLLCDPSFQLSFASVAALGLAGRRWRDAPPEGWAARAGRWLVRGLAASTAAFVATAPLVAHHFAELAPLSPIGNLLLVPPVELGIVPLGLAGAALGAVWAPLGTVPFVIADQLARVVLALAEGFRRHAPLVPVWSPDPLEATLLFAAALVSLFALGMTADRRRPVVRAALALAALGGGHLGWRAVERRIRDEVRVTFLDVGQGDAALVEGPRGFVALVDGGGSVDARFDPGLRVLEPVLRRKTVGRIDLVVLSHPHPDHMNGLLRVLERFEVRALWSTGPSDEGGASHARLRALVHARGVTEEPPRRREQDGLVLEPLGPYLDDVIAAPTGLGCNDASLVVGVGFAGRRILFTGDIEEQGEAELVGRHGADLRSDVLKIPHHGSRTSSGDELIAAVRPRLAVISLGRENRFGFPRAEVVERYRRAGVELLRTDLHGALMVSIGRDGTLRTTCARSCR